MSSKVAQYLNEHLLGEVTTNEHVRKQYSTDGSVLRIVPDMVVFPRTTSDLRKLARFSWQLAEKGHKLPLTVRGGGTDQTGAALGTGVVIDTKAHMNQIFEVDAKQKLVRVQPGVTFKALNDALRLHGLYIPSYPIADSASTIGGAIANNSSGLLSGKYGPTGDWVHQIEVVLSNGEVLQTGRINKKQMNKKRGLQTFEGEIYRGIDTILGDNAELLDNMAVDTRDNSGYNIIDVERRDGSVDLTPLVVGSQGTLGIISEIIMKAQPLGDVPLVGALAFQDNDAARDGIDVLRAMDPSVMEMIDGRLFEAAAERGKKYAFYQDALDAGNVASVVLIEFDNNGDRAKKKIAKKIAKLFENQPVFITMERDPVKSADLQLLHQVTGLVYLPEKSEHSAPPLLENAYIPAERLEDFAKTIESLEKKHDIELPLCGHVGEHLYYVRPLLNFQKVGDRQKVFKLLAEWSNAIADHGGSLIGTDGEGRLKSALAIKNMDEEVAELYKSVRGVFDPLGIMNPDVKQPVELKKLATSLRNDYTGSDFAKFSIG